MRGLKQMQTWILLAPMAAFCTIGTPAMADVDVPLSQVPAAVAGAVKSRFPGGEIMHAKRDRDDSASKYELKVVSEGARYEVEVTPDGHVLEVEREDDD